MSRRGARPSQTARRIRVSTQITITPIHLPSFARKSGRQKDGGQGNLSCEDGRPYGTRRVVFSKDRWVERRRMHASGCASLSRRLGGNRPAGMRLGRPGANQLDGWATTRRGEAVASQALMDVDTEFQNCVSAG
jgi:hypothetical protein